MEDVEQEYECSSTHCPECLCAPTHWRECSAFGCDEGLVDEHDDDPINHAPGDFSECRTCGGTGVEHWCPTCGLDLKYWPTS